MLISRIAWRGTGLKRLNCHLSTGAAAFQSVPHFHLHLIPRWNGDGKGFDWKLVPGNRDQIMKTGERLRELLK